MKLTTPLFNLAIAAIAAGALASCTNEFSELNPGKDGLSSIKLVKTPEVYAWSGQQTLQNTVSTPSDVITRGTDMNANMWNQTWACPPRPAEDLSPAELAELKALLSKGLETHNEIVLPFENYYVQQIYKGEDTYNTHDRCYQDGCDHVNDQTELGSGHMDKLLAYGKGNYEHVNNFNKGTNHNYPGACGCGEVHYKTTLMTGMPTEGIDPNKQFGFHETWGTAHDYFNYIIVEYKGYYYVGFDFEAHKPDHGTHNHGEGLDIERDWNFTDWIVRITPAYHKGETPETPTEPKDNCDQCHHPSHNEGDCSECPKDSGCNQTQQTPNQPEDKTCDHCPHEKHVGENCPDCDIATDCHPAVCDKCEHGVIWDDLQGKFIHVATSQNKDGNCGECEGTDLPCNDNNLKELVGDRVVGDNADQGDDSPSTTPSTPSSPSNKYQNEVEVNLSILDTHSKYDINDLVSKLSIHVRYPHDVEVILPVPTNIYCDQDDLYILKDHYNTLGEPNWAYDGEYHMVQYNINDNTVELHVEFVTPENDNITADKTGFIRVYTVGINEAVIDYLYKNFGDGINFEIYNYYNRGNMYTTGNYAQIDADELQGYLNHSMINFDWDEETMANRKYPNFYIMAFNELDKEAATGNGAVNEKDCYVWIFGDIRADHDNFYNDNVEYKFSPGLTMNWFSTGATRENNERSHFHNAYKGTHYNSSKYNWIFTNKSVTGSVEPTLDAMPQDFSF